MTIKRWQRTMRRWGTRSLGFGAAMTLVACTTPISYPELRQTAAVTGCWPMGYATPNPVTATPQSTTLPSLARPTTTSVPRCTPIPGAPTLRPYPTTVPTLVPYPTQQPIVVNGGNDLTTALELPRLQHVDIAVHPSEGWAAVASVWPDTAGSRHIFVRVFNPQARAWGTARQVNPPPAEKGSGLYGGVALGITGDGTIHVAWGGGNTETQPVWYAKSGDYGETWSRPEQIGNGCYRVESVATTLRNDVFVLASCSSSGGADAHPGVFQQRPDGSWLPFVRFGVQGQQSTIVIIGDGDRARAIILAVDIDRLGAASLIEKRLDGDDGWETHPFTLPPRHDFYAPNASFYLLRGLAFRRPNDDDNVIFTWSVRGSNVVHAIQSPNGGDTWGDVETIAAFAADAADAPDHRYAVPAYDVRSDRLVVFVVRSDPKLPKPGNGTHYAFWSVPASGDWQPRQVPGSYDQLIPLISGATSASWTDAAQAGNASYVWLAWIDDDRLLRVRSFPFSLVVPADQRSIPTPTGAR